ncbi:MAG: carbamoyltransferase [Magnetococcus sp. WYHC-3]
MSIVLGLNAYHADAAACLLVDGALVAAAEEERFRRIKHWAGFPSQAVAWCLESAGVTLDRVDLVAVNSDPKANLGRKLGFVLASRPDLQLIFDRLRNQGRRRSVAEDLMQAFPGAGFRGRVVAVEHHLAHLASAFLVSPFQQAVALSVDGFGDFRSTAWGLGRGEELELEDGIHFPHSLGIFYQAMTQYLGFFSYGDEYKVMGLAPYGAPRFLPEMERIVRLMPGGLFELDLDCFLHHRTRVDYQWDGGYPSVGALFSPALAERLGPARQADEPLETHHRDIARSVQAMYEKAFFHLLNHLHAHYGVDDLTLAGGCAMNSVANGKVTRQTPFRRVYIQSAAGDAGGAIGAALVAWRQEHPGQGRKTAMPHACWGPSFDSTAIQSLLEESRDALESAGCQVQRMEDATARIDLVATRIAAGDVVGWFQGRMEWGPRALGCRSILCDPRRGDMKDILNRKIKRRESFRPFAPAILREAVPDWFEVDDDVPFMMKVFPIRQERQAEIPAVTHVDGSGRLQTVEAHHAPLYHALIRRFGELTGVPILLNTSFNENEPVVCRPREALDCYLRTRMDLLVMEDWVVSRGGG